VPADVVGGSTTKPPTCQIRTSLIADGGGPRDLIIGNIVHFESAVADTSRAHVENIGSVRQPEAHDAPIQADGAKAAASRDLIIRDVIGLELASVDVAHHQVPRSRTIDGSEANKLPIQADGAYHATAGNLVIADVVELEPTRVGVAQDHVGFAGPTAEIAERQRLQFKPTEPMKLVPVIWLLLMS